MLKKAMTASPSNDPLSAAALVEVYLAVRPKLERLIARRVGSTSMAHDLTQDIFFRIGSIKARFPSRADAERYFLRVAANASLDHLKVEGRRRAILEGSLPLFQHPSPSPETEVLAMDDLRLVDAALSELPPKCREVLILSQMHGLSHAEIAAKLGVSRSLVEKYVVRSLLHCRRRLASNTAQK